MKKILTVALIGILVQAVLSAAVPETHTNTSLDRPVPQEYYRRFVVCDRMNGTGFYWLDSTTGHLREFDRSKVEWEDHGIQKGMQPGPQGTYILWPDNRRGVYVLNTRTGKGWWFNESRWEIIERDDS